MNKPIETTDDLMELLKQFPNHKLNMVVNTFRKVGSGSLFPEIQHGTLEYCDSSCSEKTLMLELVTGEELTYVEK